MSCDWLTVHSSANHSFAEFYKMLRWHSSACVHCGPMMDNFLALRRSLPTTPPSPFFFSSTLFSTNNRTSPKQELGLVKLNFFFLVSSKSFWYYFRNILQFNKFCTVIQQFWLWKDFWQWQAKEESQPFNEAAKNWYLVS